MIINSICVCGAGTMGASIAQTLAQAGFYTILYDLNPVMLENAGTRIEKNLGDQTQKGRLRLGEKERITGLIRFTGDIQSCVADVFIEAIVEKPELKLALFNQLAELNHSECIFASNTSSLSITRIAEKIKNPERVIGMHFFNPATIMKLVEIVNTTYTNSNTTDTIVELAMNMGKTPVLCRDSPGFIVNRVARPYYIESLRIVEEGLTDISHLDMLLEATGFKLGPFKLMDLIGNDVNYAVSCSVFEQLGKPARLMPSPIQEQKVKDGKLGRKSGEGYYPYPQKKN